MFFLPIFLVGIFFGSFLNVLIDRLPKGQPVLFDRSRCDSCGKVLKVTDLIPIVSWLALSGRCRYCRSPLSLYYPVVEITTGILFVFVFSFSVFPESIFLLTIFSCLMVIFFADLKYGIIPDQILYPLAGASLLYLISINGQLLNHFLSGVAILLFFFALFRFTGGRGMGFGDVKLSFFLGFFLGWPNTILAVYVAFLTGALISIILIVLGKKKLKGDTIAFGPFLVIGTIVAYFFGNQILSKIFQ